MNTKFKNTGLRTPMSIPVTFILISLLFSCGSKQGSGVEAKDDTTVTNTNATQTTFTGVTFPSFIIQYDNLEKLHGGIFTNKPKLLLKIGIPDLSKPDSIELVPYFTKTHGHYAEGDSPLPNAVTLGPHRSEEIKAIIIGNNDITLKRLLRKNGSPRKCDYFIFVPSTKNYPGDPKNHLCFKIIAVTVNKATGKLSEEIIAYSNPTPPGRPSEEN